ncbi:MAG TPA: hypothetical protein VNW92_27560, partial [Polyangiaceae bacterium]|nr:hypothetical protein [Polyangiaceae bacterium]
VMSNLRAALLEAVDTLRTETSRDVEALFGERVLEPVNMSPTAAHAAGIIEGVGIALGLTALELLDEVDAL